MINRHFDGPLRARGQALYSVLGYGVSGVIGGVGGGALSEKWGFGAVFWAASIVAVLAALSGFSGTVGTLDVRSCFADNEINLPDEETGLVRVIQDFLITFMEV